MEEANCKQAILIDLRFETTIDEILLNELIDYMGSHLIRVMVLTGPNLRDELELKKINNNQVFYTAADVTAFLEKRFIEEIDNVSIDLVGNISFQSLSDSLRKGVIEERLKTSDIISVNLSKITTISTPSIFLLSHAMNEFSSKHGVLWCLKVDNTVNNVVEKLNKCRFFDINSKFSYIVGTEPVRKKLELGRNASIVYNNAKSIKIEFDELLDRIKYDDRYSSYLKEARSKSFEHAHTSYNPQRVHYPVFTWIRHMVYELIDNVLEHSGGKGMYLASIENQMLFIFLGDNGIGLKDGILRNYILNDVIVDDKSALETAFKLTKYHDKRIKSNPFDDYGGYGLANTLSNVFLLNGVFLARSGSAIRVFANPVSKSKGVNKAIDYGIHFSGTQYILIVPLNSNAKPPSTKDQLLYDKV